MKTTIIHEAYRLIIASFGIILLGLSINYLSWRYQLVSSGLPGYALSTNYLTGFPVGMFLLIANTIILLFSFFIAGKTAGLRGVYGYTFLSLFIDWQRKFFQIHQVILPSFLKNLGLIMAQGAIAPLAIALVMANGYSFGSYSSMMPIVKKFSRISAPRFFLLMDSILTILTFFQFGFTKAVLLGVNAGIFFLAFRLALPYAERRLSVRAPMKIDNSYQSE